MSKVLICTMVFLAASSTGVAAQPPATPVTARVAAPFNLDGTWVAVITEDWRWRMLVPKHGDATSVPLNEAGVEATKGWDPARDAAAGEHCKAFGAGGLMRLPLRFRVSWEDDRILRIDTEAGQQTRRFVFSGGASPPPVRGVPPYLPPLQPGPVSEPSLQGTTVARWNSNTLEAVTSNTSGGYLRRNGVPYSAQAIIREYWNLQTDFGQDWLTVTTVVSDPTYLRQDFITSSHFKRESAGSQWAPFPCEQL